MARRATFSTAMHHGCLRSSRSRKRICRPAAARLDRPIEPPSGISARAIWTALSIDSLCRPGASVARAPRSARSSRRASRCARRSTLVLLARRGRAGARAPEWPAPVHEEWALVGFSSRRRRMAPRRARRALGQRSARVEVREARSWDPRSYATYAPDLRLGFCSQRERCSRIPWPTAASQQWWWLESRHGWLSTAHARAHSEHTGLRRGGAGLSAGHLTPMRGEVDRVGLRHAAISRLTAFHRPRRDRRVYARRSITPRILLRSPAPLRTPLDA